MPDKCTLPIARNWLAVASGQHQAVADGAPPGGPDREPEVAEFGAHAVTAAEEDGVGLGSDFDGAVIPAAIGDCSGLPALGEAMLANGFGTELTQKICAGNWQRFLRENLPD